jgi:hypothetical protein
VCQAEAANTAFKPDASPGCAPACPEAGVLCALESLTALNSTEATESGSLQRLQCSQRHQRFNPAGLARFNEIVQRGKGVASEEEASLSE